MSNLNNLLIKAITLMKEDREQIYLSFIHYDNDRYISTCCYMKNGKETRREILEHTTSEEALQHIRDKVVLYSYELVNNILYGQEMLE